MKLTKEDIKHDEEQWWKDHPEYMRCKQCDTVIKKVLTHNNLCPDCYTWKRRWERSKGR